MDNPARTRTQGSRELVAGNGDSAQEVQIAQGPHVGQPIVVQGEGLCKGRSRETRTS
jgi:hypothetical protein